MDKINLLVFIDDDYATNFYHKVIVRDSGLVDNFLFFSTAKAALAHFQIMEEEGNNLKPDAIFLDINMPEINGWEFLELYAKTGAKKAPIYIMLTTSLNPTDTEKAELNPLVRGLKNKPLTEEHLKELQQELLLNKVI